MHELFTATWDIVVQIISAFTLAKGIEAKSGVLLVAIGIFAVGYEFGRVTGWVTKPEAAKSVKEVIARARKVLGAQLGAYERHVRTILKVLTLLLLLSVLLGGIRLLRETVTKNRCRNELIRLGFQVSSTGAACTVSSGSNSVITNLNRTLSLLRSARASSFALDGSGIGSVVSMGPLTNMPSLRTLTILHCYNLTNLVGEWDAPNLTHVTIDGCTALRSIDALAGLTNMISLTVGSCKSLDNISALHNMISLQQVVVTSCTGIWDICSVSSLTNLTNININGDTGIQILPDTRRLRKLQRLEFSNTGVRDVAPAMVSGSMVLSCRPVDIERLPQWQQSWFKPGAPRNQ